MSVRGMPSGVWASQFPDDYVPTLLELILSSWNTFQIPKDRHENPISKKFCAHLRNNKKRDEHFFRIELESSEIDIEGNELGRIDLKFIWCESCDEHVYFSIECKRLRATAPSGRFSSLARQYVEEGMHRYFNGQYAAELNKGGMLGYVIDGDTEAAIGDVKKAIETRRSMLHMEPAATLKASGLVNNEQAKHTCHSRQDKSLFDIHHIFLPV